LEKNDASFKNLTATENKNQQKRLLEIYSTAQIHAVSLVVINCTYSFSYRGK